MTEAPAPSSTRKYEILTGLVIIGFIFGGFALGEAGLRAIQYAKFGTQASVEGTSAFYKDEATGLRLIRPSQQMGKIKINALGFRGDDVPLPKPKDVIRLLFIGSSTTYDAAASETENWPTKTVQMLREAAPQCKFDFVNAGQPGYSTKAMLTLYEAKLRDLGGDVAIILAGDINSDLDWLAVQQGFSADHYQPSVLAQHSVLWGKLAKNLEIIERQRSAFSRAGKAKVDLPALAGRFEGRVDALVGALQRDNVDVLMNMIGSQLREDQSPDQQVRAGNSNLFYMPNFALQDIMATRLAYNDVIKELSAAGKFETLNGNLSVPADAFHYEDSAHFRPPGSAVMARNTAQQLLVSTALNDEMRDRGCQP